LFAIHVAKLANQITFPNKWAEIFMQAYLLQSRFSLRLAARQYGEVVFRQLADGALFAVFALRSLGEVGPGTNFIEHYACRACPVRAKRVTGVQV
jgi:hypothetical protein